MQADGAVQLQRRDPFSSMQLTQSITDKLPWGFHPDRLCAGDVQSISNTIENGPAAENPLVSEMWEGMKQGAEWKVEHEEKDGRKVHWNENDRARIQRILGNMMALCYFLRTAWFFMCF